jgi:hypothetical protein
MSISDEKINNLNNPNPPKTVKRGETYSVMNTETHTIEEGTVESVIGNTVVIRTPSGIHTYWISALWQDKNIVQTELDMQLHPVRKQIISDIKSVKDLLHFLIINDFTGDNAEDSRKAVSIKSKELLGIDPFDEEVK